MKMLYKESPTGTPYNDRRPVTRPPGQKRKPTGLPLSLLKISQSPPRPPTPRPARPDPNHHSRPASGRAARLPAARPQAKRHSPGPPSPDLRTRSEPAAAARHSTHPRRSRPGRISAQHPGPEAAPKAAAPRRRHPAQLRRRCPRSGPDQPQKAGPVVA